MPCKSASGAGWVVLHALVLRRYEGVEASAGLCSKGPGVWVCDIKAGAPLLVVLV